MPSTFNDIIDGVSTSLAVKAPVRVASTTHLALSGLVVVEGVQTTEDMRILVNAQNNAVDNGIYNAKSGAWQRAKDFDGARDAAYGTTVFSAENSKFYRLSTPNPVVIGTDDIHFVVTILSEEAGEMQVVDNVADLRLTIAAADGQTIGLAGYYEPGDAPFRTVWWDAASTATDDGGRVFQVTGVVTGRWKSTIVDFMDIRLWGAKLDNTTDDYDAWNRALNSALRLDTDIFSGPHCGTIIFPNVGISYVSQTLQWKAYGTLKGDGSHITNAHSCIWRNPTNVGAIQFNSYNTLGTTTVAAGGASAGSTIDGISFRGGYWPGSVGTTGHGIRMRAQGILNNVNVRGYAEKGILISGTAGSGGDTEGNCNLTRVSNTRIQNCGSHGIEVFGADANACMFDRIDATANGGIGIYEHSFLGNGWYSCHSDSNTTLNYKSESAACSTFVGCYQESATPLSQFSQATIVLGGILTPDNTSTYNGIHLLPDAGFLRSNRGYRSFMYVGGVDTGDAVDVRLGGNPANGDIVYASHETIAPNVWRLVFDATFGGTFALTYANSVGSAGFFVTGPSSTLDFGRSAPEPYALVVPKFFTGTSGRQITHAAAAPSSGEWARGDVIFSTVPVAGGSPGWICTTSGTGGSTAVFKAMAAVAA